MRGLRRAALVALSQRASEHGRPDQGGHALADPTARESQRCSVQLTRQTFRSRTDRALRSTTARAAVESGSIAVSSTRSSSGCPRWIRQVDLTRSGVHRRPTTIGRTPTRAPAATVTTTTMTTTIATATAGGAAGSATSSTSTNRDDARGASGALARHGRTARVRQPRRPAVRTRTAAPSADRQRIRPDMGTVESGRRPGSREPRP